jgi:uncharacterized coiled-coil protein SlyX
MEDLLYFDFVDAPTSPSYYELEQNIIQQNRKIDELSETIKEMKNELQEMRQNKMKRIENIEKKVEDFDSNKFKILKQMNHNLMIEFYYVDLKKVVEYIRDFQIKGASLLKIGSIPTYINERVSVMKKNNEVYLQRQNFKNVNVSIPSENELKRETKCETFKFIAEDLIVKKIEIPIDSKIVDLSNKIIISRLDIIQHFLNIQKLIICPYQILVEHINQPIQWKEIVLHNISFNSYLNGRSHMPNYLKYFKKRDLEGELLGSLTGEDLEYLSSNNINGWKY